MACKLEFGYNSKYFDAVNGYKLQQQPSNYYNTKTKKFSTK